MSYKTLGSDFIFATQAEADAYGRNFVAHYDASQTVETNETPNAQLEPGKY